MTKIKTLIVEDEKNNADLLAHFLNKYCPTIEVIGIAYS
jgi:CheY-like chemotaxis protein|tara:strand:- start:3072 stop:3188 length:117 start_codon:yes stop_codon:yes gene_type:complete